MSCEAEGEEEDVVVVRSGFIFISHSGVLVVVVTCEEMLGMCGQREKRAVNQRWDHRE